MTRTADAPARAFSVQDCDAYIDHLANLNAQGKLVVAREDIANEFGVHLLQRGAPLGIFAAEKMRGHRLNTAVDAVLDFRRRLGADGLIAAFGELLSQEPDLAGIHARFAAEDRLRHLCNTLALPPALLQQLAVVQHALPRVFHRALFCAWLGTLIALERRLPADELELLFQAGLVHDIGLLHIDPALVDKKTGIAAEEWAAISSHPAIGAAITGSASPQLARLGRILAQHHERGDGSGYPGGLVQEEIDPLALLLSLCDMVHALRFPTLLTGQYSLADCMAYLRVNRKSIGDANYRAVGRVLQKGQAKAPPRPGSLPPLHGLIDANRSLITLLQMFGAASPGIAAAPDRKLARSALALIEQVQWVASASGIGSVELGVALEQSLEQRDTAAATPEIFSTMRELFWLVRRIDRQLEELLAGKRGADSSHDIVSLSSLIKSELKRSWRLFADPAATRR